MKNRSPRKNEKTHLVLPLLTLFLTVDTASAMGDYTERFVIGIGSAFFTNAAELNLNASYTLSVSK
jgi:hypothetical protein